MSHAETREAIAAAAITVDAVDVLPVYRQSLTALQGFVRWAGRVPDSSGFGWVDTWEVWLALPSSVQTSEEWIADHLPELLAALGSELQIDAANPAELVLGSTSVNGLIITGRLATTQ